MISLITTLKNRAHLLKWGLTGIFCQDFWFNNPEERLEINVGDSGSNDGLDGLLQEVSENRIVERVRKYTIDRSKSVYNHPFNCPAEEYNILVKLASYDTILKIDPEVVLIRPSFITEAYKIIQERPAIVMPFTYHLNEFSFDNIDQIFKYWEEHVYPTHITKENAQDRGIYYGALFSRNNYKILGGVDERFITNIGYEDDVFLQQCRRKYGYENTPTLVDYSAVHLYHGPTTVPQHLSQFVEQNVQLGKLLRNEWPNQTREWGRIYKHIEMIEWIDGERV
jgi:hypothetical protein